MDIVTPCHGVPIIVIQYAVGLSSDGEIACGQPGCKNGWYLNGVAFQYEGESDDSKD